MISFSSWICVGQVQLTSTEESLHLKEESLLKLQTDFLALNQLRIELETRVTQLLTDNERASHTNKRLEEDLNTQSSHLQKLKEALQTKTEQLHAKVSWLILNSKTLRMANLIVPLLGCGAGWRNARKRASICSKQVLRWKSQSLDCRPG